jgi:hypothetical protein
VSHRVLVVRPENDLEATGHVLVRDEAGPLPDQLPAVYACECGREIVADHIEVLNPHHERDHLCGNCLSATPDALIERFGLREA